MNYRFDNRSKKQFKKDIKERTLEERSLFILWLDFVERETGKRPAYTDTGCGKNGDFLEDEKVSTDPDFQVEGYGSVEVKFAKPLLDKVFHLKANQVRSYIKKKAVILMVNGSRTESPRFTMLDAQALEDIVESCDVVPWQGFGGKPSYKIPVNKFIWRPLK